MDVSVVVPRRPDGAERDRNWQWLRSRLESEFPDWEVVEGEHLDGPWCKALAVEDALTRATGETLVIADADVWATDLERAVQRVINGDRWGQAHGRLARLTNEATMEIIAGAELPTHRTKRVFEHRSDNPKAGGGLVVVRRDVYEEIPIDPRFQGFGGEDWAWAIALQTLARPYHRDRNGLLLHLWHPPQERMSRAFGNPANKALHKRYAAAKGDKVAMRSLLEEARCFVPS